MMTYTLTIFREGTDMSTKPREIVRYITFRTRAQTMDRLNQEITHILKINGYEHHKFLCKLQLRTENT